MKDGLNIKRKFMNIRYVFYHLLDLESMNLIGLTW